MESGLRPAYLPEPCDTLWQESMVGDGSNRAELVCRTGEAMWTPITDDGRAVAQQPVELSQEDREDEMMVELHTDVGCIASAVARIADIWAVSIQCSNPLHPDACRMPCKAAVVPCKAAAYCLHSLINVQPAEKNACLHVTCSCGDPAALRRW